MSTIDIVTTKEPLPQRPITPHRASLTPIHDLFNRWMKEARELYEAAGPITQKRGKHKVVIGFKDEKKYRRAQHVASWAHRLSQGA